MKKWLTYIFLLLSFPLVAETIVVGTVVDAITLEPIENANVYYKGTQIGCATNSEGLFMVRAELDKTRTLIVSALGYRQQRYKIEPDSYAGVEVAMQPEPALLSEISAMPDQKQALELIRRIRDHRQINDLSLQNSYSYGITEEKNLYLSDLQSRFFDKHLKKYLDQATTILADSTVVVPLFLSNTDYSINGTDATIVGTPARQSVILTETDFAFLLDGIEIPLNFYHNVINIFSKTFLSPLAASAPNHYRYYLADSVSAAAGKHYIIHFRTRNTIEPTFNGELIVDSASCRLVSLTAQVPAQANVNFVRSIVVDQHFADNGGLDYENMAIVFDFAVKTDNSHIFPTALLTRHLTAVQTPADPTEKTMQATETLPMDSLKDIPIIRVASWIAHLINTGNLRTGTPVDIGPAVEIIGGSRKEGLHLGVPLTTNEKMSDKVELSAYVAYGFRDQQLKYKAQIRWKMPTERRHILSAYYWNHYVQTDVSMASLNMRENALFYGEQDFTHWAFSALRYNHQTADPMEMQRELKVWLEDDWSKNIETKIAFRIGSQQIDPLNTSFTYKSAQADLRLGFSEKKIDLFMRRYRSRSRYPVLHLMAEIGSYQTQQMNYENVYAHVGVLLTQYVQLPMLGHIDYAVCGGAIFGAVPYTMLTHFTGNQSYSYDPYRFTLLNSYQYAADRYLMAHLNWNMGGALFNRIPLIKYLRLRELLELKVAYGWLSDKHADVLSLPNTLTAMQMPYIEAGVGIGNILRIAEIYAVFRLTDFSNPTTPWWAIRARFNIDM